MPKHILVISTSPRKGGNSETLANEFIRGAEESGNQVEKDSRLLCFLSMLRLFTNNQWNRLVKKRNKIFISLLHQTANFPIQREYPKICVNLQTDVR